MVGPLLRENAANVHVWRSWRHERLNFSVENRPNSPKGEFGPKYLADPWSICRPKVALRRLLVRKGRRKGHICRRQIWPFSVEKKIYYLFRPLPGHFPTKWPENENSKFSVENLEFQILRRSGILGKNFFDRKIWKLAYSQWVKVCLNEREVRARCVHGYRPHF